MKYTPASTVEMLSDAHVAVVGLGLMGGSLAGALRGHCRAVTGIDHRPETIETAQQMGLVDYGTTNLADGVAEADIVVLATPVRVILQQLTMIGPLVPPGCLVMDLGSTKAEVTAAMGRLPAHVQPLGGHPMCGKEISGIETADPALYQGCTFILSPLRHTSEEALALGKALVMTVGASPLVLQPARQDFLAATLSHLPYLLACALVATADTLTSPDPAAWKIVAGGFRDTSRVAGSDVTMMIDILLTNRKAVLKALSVYQDRLQELFHLVESGDEEKMQATLRRIRCIRREMFP
ncbi:MAG TPA: prephenate dehydrogenase [Chloroflexi bacterium]|nr:prephenate dehydrogenase [Chloroflexota bacterium]